MVDREPTLSERARVLVERAARAHRTIAVAESCTGGLVGKLLTDAPGASAAFVGGVIAYANDVKVGLLGVPEEMLATEGAVSEAVARRMAEGVVEATGATTSIAVTGVAGPGGGSEEKPVGTVWIATVVAGRTEAECERFSGDRDMIRRGAAEVAIARLQHRIDAE